MTLVVKSKVKEAAKKHDLRFPDRSVNALNDKILQLIEEAARRAADNKRKTLIPSDF